MLKARLEGWLGRMGKRGFTLSASVVIGHGHQKIQIEMPEVFEDDSANIPFMLMESLQAYLQGCWVSYTRPPPQKLHGE